MFSPAELGAAGGSSSRVPLTVVTVNEGAGADGSGAAVGADGSDAVTSTARPSLTHVV
jgi:hypothetical protein